MKWLFGKSFLYAGSSLLFSASLSLYFLPLLACFTLWNCSSVISKPMPNSMLWKADTITFCPSCFGTNTRIPQSGTQHCFERQFYLKIHSPWPNMFKGLKLHWKRTLNFPTNPFYSSICLKASTWNSTIWLLCKSIHLKQCFLILSIFLACLGLYMLGAGHIYVFLSYIQNRQLLQVFHHHQQSISLLGGYNT